MYKRQTTVVNKMGLHARPASEFVATAGKFKSAIRIRNLSNNSDEANAKSIVILLSLSLTKGALVQVSAEGEDETRAVDTLISLIDSGFGDS